MERFVKSAAEKNLDSDAIVKLCGALQRTVFSTLTKTKSVTNQNFERVSVVSLEFVRKFAASKISPKLQSESQVLEVYLEFILILNDNLSHISPENKNDFLWLVVTLIFDFMVLKPDIDANVCVRIASNSLIFFDYQTLTPDRCFMILKYLGLLLKKNLDEEHRANLYQILANVTKNNLMHSNEPDRIWLSYIECTMINYKLSIENKLTDMEHKIVEDVGSILILISTNNLLDNEKGQELWTETIRISG